MQAIQYKTFRADLYYRLNVLSITMPPLRERSSDIPALVQSFLNRYSQMLKKRIPSISSDAMEALIQYPWPGNVRELENIIERVVNFIDANQITIHDLPQEIVKKGTAPSYRSTVQDSNTTDTSFEPFLINDDAISPQIYEYKQIVTLLKLERGHVKSVAKQANIPLSTLYRKLKKYNLEPKEFQNW